MQRPTTGENAATWFVWNNCGTWKEFPVIPGETYYIKPSTNGAQIIDARHEIQENIDGEWTTQYTYQDSLGFHDEDIYTYVPETNTIRIQNNGNRGFYIQVYGERVDSPDSVLQPKIDQKIELAQHIDSISILDLEDERQANDSINQIKGSNTETKTKVDGLSRLKAGEEITDVTLAVSGPGESPPIRFSNQSFP